MSVPVLVLSALLLPAQASRPGEARCSPSPWFSARAVLDVSGLPEGVQVDSTGPLPRLSNPGSTPLVLFRDDSSPRSLPAADLPWTGLPLRMPVARLVDGQSFHYFESGVPMEGKQHLKGWQNPFGQTSELLPVPPATLSPAGPGRPETLDPIGPEPFELRVYWGAEERSLKGEWVYAPNADYDATACIRP